MPYASRHTTAWVDERQDHNRWRCDGTLGGFRHRDGDPGLNKTRPNRPDPPCEPQFRPSTSRNLQPNRTPPVRRGPRHPATAGHRQGPANSHRHVRRATRPRRRHRLFTTHTGAPVDLGNFSATGFKPAVAAAFASPADQHLATTPFRRLRAAAITDWISHGFSSEEASEKAGNSSVVVERHYRGCSTPAPDRRPMPRSRPVVPVWAAELPDDFELAALNVVVIAERRHRLERDGQIGGD